MERCGCSPGLNLKLDFDPDRLRLDRYWLKIRRAVRKPCLTPVWGITSTFRVSVPFRTRLAATTLMSEQKLLRPCKPTQQNQSLCLDACVLWGGEGGCCHRATGGCALGHARLHWCLVAGVQRFVWSLQVGLCFCLPHVFWHCLQLHLPIPLAFSAVLPPKHAAHSCLLS